jgi:hypothetical protein
MMKHGGNTKLKEFFQKYNIPSDGPLEFKYKTRAAYYYREMVLNKPCLVTELVKSFS